MHTAELIFQQSGLKSTVSRLEVTTVLTRNEHPLTHQEILSQLADSFDRVTLYRVLDWLLQNEVVHRISGEDRAWRYQLNANHKNKTNKTKYSNADSPNNKTFKQHSHAHFQCDYCGKVFCLDEVYPKLTHNLPTNFVVDSIELNIKGKCANCHK
jgi:Fur family transcriptional regulator, ferric uptake regulator